MSNKTGDSKQERVARRLMEAAAGPEPDDSLPPYFMTRLKQRIEEQHPEQPTLGATAWRMVPAMIVLLALLTGWTGYQHVQTQNARDAAIQRLTGSEASLGDMVVAAFFLPREVR